MSLQNFGDQLHEKIRDQCDGDKARALTSAYDQAQSKLEQDVYPNIRGSEPNLSDHGGTHVSNVQQNVIRLLSDDGIITDLTGIEMYCLGMLILFHDAGNVYGRGDHHKKVSRIFDQIRGTEASVRHEKTLIVKAARAHTGTSQDGSRDTLKEVDEVEHLAGYPVRLRQLAAVLRFADELAEGPQRTSDFMQEEDLYSSGSKMYHDYASSTNIFIERKSNRIVATYEIEIDTEKPEKLTDSLNFIFERIQKLNQERQYARYYSSLLEPFKFTQVSFNFHCNGDIIETDLLPLRLTDIVIPGDQAKEIATVDPAYSTDRLVKDLLARCQERKRYESGS